jgi:hypothetical protein
VPSLAIVTLLPPFTEPTADAVATGNLSLDIVPVSKVAGIAVIGIVILVVPLND